MRYLIPLLLTVPLLSSCVGADPSVVAVLVADAASPGRAVDEDVFTEQVDEVCDGCTVRFYDAEGDAGRQREQFDEVMAAGVGAVVVEPVDVEAAEEFVVAADVPFVAVGTLVPGADWFVGTAEPVEGAEYGSDLEAARALVDGSAKEVVHVPVSAISTDAANVVVHAMVRTPYEGSEEYEGVPSWLHEPDMLTTANLTTVLVAPGLVSLEEICEGETKRCEELGLL